LYQLEDQQIIQIDDFDYQKSKTSLKGFQTMLKVTLDEIESMFSPQSNLAYFIVKTLKFSAETQNTQGMKHEFQLYKHEGDRISFYVFALEFSVSKNNVILPLFKMKRDSCAFEKLTATISTTIDKCDKFKKVYHEGTNSLMDVRNKFNELFRGKELFIQ
jgi:hypothetical protein